MFKVKSVQPVIILAGGGIVGASRVSVGRAVGVPLAGGGFPSSGPSFMEITDSSTVNYLKN